MKGTILPMKPDINRAMSEPDRFAVEISYKDKWGDVTKRTVSPIRWVDCGDAFLALCLGREEPRRFELRRVIECRLIEANDVLMPARIENGPTA